MERWFDQPEPRQRMKGTKGFHQERSLCFSFRLPCRRSGGQWAVCVPASAPFQNSELMLFLSSAGGIVMGSGNTSNIMLSNIITSSATWIFSKFCLVPVTKFGAKVQLFCFFLPGLRTSFNCSSENAGNHDVFALPSLLVLRNKRCVICSPVEYWSISIIVVIATPKVLILVFF